MKLKSDVMLPSEKNYRGTIVIGGRDVGGLVIVW